MFSSDSVTVIRKRDGVYIDEVIKLDSILPNSRLTIEENRKNVIARLRNDSSVAFVLETQNGSFIQERAVIDGGFELNIKVNRLRTPFASFVVIYKGHIAYEQEFNIEPPDYDEKRAKDSFLQLVITILNAIDSGDYGFLDPDDPDQPYFCVCEPMPLDSVKQILQEEGYQCETIYVRQMYNPFLFIHENDLVLIGSRHFSGSPLFVEIKRCFTITPSEESTIKSMARGSSVAVIRWYDDSWSFRITIENHLNKNQLVKSLLSDVEEIKAFIRQIETQVDDNGYSNDHELIRNLFVYENMDASVKLSQILI